VDELTVPRLMALNRYWANHPPVHIMIAAYLGVKPRETRKNTEHDMRELIAMFGAGGAP
jgi:hypothetical protein